MNTTETVTDERPVDSVVADIQRMLQYGSGDWKPLMREAIRTIQRLRAGGWRPIDSVPRSGAGVIFGWHGAGGGPPYTCGAYERMGAESRQEAADGVVVSREVVAVALEYLRVSTHKRTCATYPVGASASCDCGYDKNVAELQRALIGEKTK